MEGMKYGDKYDEAYIRYLLSVQEQVDGEFSSLSDEVAALVFPYLTADDYFTFRGNKKADGKIGGIIRGISENLVSLMGAGIAAAWGLSGKKNDALVERVFEKVLKTKEIPKVYVSHDTGLNRLRTRKVNGLTFSDRVWRYTDTLQGELEVAINAAMEDGRSAAQLSRDIRKYLKNPDALYRRVRDKEGNPALSKAAAVYHPGRGVYRSAYKNARRLAATEINRAYRTADYERRQRLDFVVGIKVSLSDNHTLNGVPFTDICDDLQGLYPKDFKFTGWHPLCRCFAVPVLKSEAEMKADNERMLRGEEPGAESVNEVKDVPEGFKKWIAENKERIEKAKSLPYFLQDNSAYLGNNISLTGTAKQGIREVASQELTARPIKPVSDPNKGFSIYKEYSNGGRIEIMDGYAGKSDHKDLRTIAGEWAMEGKVVQITTAVHYKDPLYGRVFGALNGTKYGRKCPDLIVNGKFYEYESYVPPFKKEKISHMIGKGTVQSSRIIINNNKGASDRYLLKNIHNRLKDKNFKNNIDEVWTYEKGKVRLLYKKK
jgi:hypothetical protein